MTRIVPAQQREETISRNIPRRKNIIQVTRKDSQRRKIGSFFDESSLKRKLQKSALYAEDRDILQKNCPKNEKAAKLLEQAKIHADDTPFSDVESLLP